MKKLLRVLVLLIAFAIGAAYWEGWKLSCRVRASDLWKDDELDDACAVGVIGCSDAPSAILVEHGSHGLFRRMVFFFANRFLRLRLIPYQSKSRRTTRKAEPQ